MNALDQITSSERVEDMVVAASMLSSKAEMRWAVYTACDQLRLIIVHDQTASSVGVTNTTSSEHMKEYVDNGDGDKKLDVIEVCHPVQATHADSNSSVLKGGWDH